MSIYASIYVGNEYEEYGWHEVSKRMEFSPLTTLQNRHKHFISALTNQPIQGYRLNIFVYFISFFQQSESGE